LARSFRYYEKKRGNRRTGSPTLGSMGEVVLWAFFLLLGCGGAAVMISGFVVPEWRVNHEFVETTCKVLEKRIGEKPGNDGPLYRPEIKIEYEVGGEVYRDWHYDIHQTYSSGQKNAQAILDHFTVHDGANNKRYPCWFDPAKPDAAVLVRGYGWWIWLVFTIPTSFVAIGAGGLIYTLLHWGKSAEHRAAISQRSQDRDFFGDADETRRYPSVPQGADLMNSPGTKLRFRLPMATSPGWALFGALAFCLLWNGITWVFAVMAIRNHLAGRPDWFLSLFILPFILVGIAAIGLFFRQLLITTGIGPTLLEISDHPVEPAGQYRLFLSQSGRLTINSIRVFLACEESATYRQGTNTRTETQEVFRRELYRREAFNIESGLPFEMELDWNVPDAAMHSFKSDHNEINWTLIVDADVANWPNFKRSFPIIIRPAGGSARR
jgi:hypothetical protein